MKSLLSALGLVVALAYQSYVLAQDSHTGINHIASNQPGIFGSGTDVNALIGADTFYNAGFTGQGTIAANVEAGHAWNGHETLTHVTQFENHSSAFGNSTADLFDRHATWTAQHIGGRGNGIWQQGIAPGTDLRSGAIATGWNGSAYALSFGISGNSLDGGYAPFFGTADVINSSWGGTDGPGTGVIARRLDGLAALNAGSTLVASAGNSGSAGSVGSPGSGYNAITVAALANGGDNSYNTVAGFSSRGPQDYGDPTNGTIQDVRAAVDIAAPGTNLHGAFYGGQTGGNNTTLPGSSDTPGNNLYNTSIAGTSFSAPIVAGAVALVKSASYNTPSLNTTEARDTRVVKSILQNSAIKTVGWDNGQVANANGGVTTTQSLDWAAGAGALNLDGAFQQFVGAGTQDVAGVGSGDLGLVDAVGWDFGQAIFGVGNLYEIDSLLAGGSIFNVTLNWFRNRAYVAFSGLTEDIAQADLNLRVWDLDSNLLISESASLYNTTEHLSFVLPTTSRYGIEVFYAGNTFGTIDDVNYGLAWSGFSAVPEPGSILMITMSIGCMTFYRRRRS